MLLRLFQSKNEIVRTVNDQWQTNTAKQLPTLKAPTGTAMNESSSKTAPPPKISVVICTSGVRSTLERTMLSLMEQTLPMEDYELVLVVNAPEESTCLEVKNSLSHLDAESKSRLRYVHEPQPGLSLARNAGIHASEGTYIAFIDDDGLAEPEWLEQIVQRFDANDKIASVGGNIFPVFEETPPSWVTPQLYPYFSCFIFSKEETFLEPGRYFFGTNMAFRKDVLLASGGFDARLGRKGNSLLSNEEWTVFHYIDQQNLLKLSSPQVNVHHIIPPSRLIRRFFIRRLWWQGVSDTVFQLQLDRRDKWWVIKNALNKFGDYYGSLLEKLRTGVSTKHLAFFNLFRWGGIIYALCTVPAAEQCKPNNKGTFHD